MKKKKKRLIFSQFPYFTGIFCRCLDLRALCGRRRRGGKKKQKNRERAEKGRKGEATKYTLMDVVVSGEATVERVVTITTVS